MKTDFFYHWKEYRFYLWSLLLILIKNLFKICTLSMNWKGRRIIWDENFYNSSTRPDARWGYASILTRKSAASNRRGSRKSKAPPPLVLEKSTRARGCKVGRSPPGGAGRVSFGVAMQENRYARARKHVRAQILVFTREKKCTFTHTGMSDDFTCILHTLTAHRCWCVYTLSVQAEP